MNWLLIIEYIDIFFFAIAALTVFYLFIFAWAAMINRGDKYPEVKKKHRFAIIFPAFAEDRVIVSSVNSFLQQDYPKENYDIIVVSDHMTDETNKQLRELPIILLEVTYEDSSKSKALNFAVDHIDASKYDVAVIMDADNIAVPNFLQYINKTYAAGSNAIQAHRVAKNLNTHTAVLDAVSEEINNSIFRAGHVRLGFSSALIGSGMAFDYKWFKVNIKETDSCGEDKELEALLLRQNIYIEYLDSIHVYDEKTQKKEAFNKQRRRWMAAQLHSLTHSFPDLLSAIFSGNFDYADKILQWMMLPRIVLIALILFLGCATTAIYWPWGIKWWILLFTLALTFSIAIPNYLVDIRFTKAMKNIPYLGFSMIFNLFRLRGRGKKFTHTQHES